MNNEGKVEVKEQDKHITLSNAIDDIDNVIDQARGILDRIQGNGSGKGDEDTISTTLQDVLANGPNRIREKNNELFKILDEIESIIF